MDRRPALDNGQGPTDSQTRNHLETLMPAAFDDIEIGQVVTLGTRAVDAKALEAFTAAFAPGWPVENGAPDAMIFAI